MVNLVRSELFRSRKRLQTWILIGITLGLDLVLYAGLLIAHIVRPDRQGTIDAMSIPKMFETGLTIVSIIGTIVTVVYGSSIIGSEFSWNTLRPALARAPKRSDLLSAKWITAIIFSAVLALLGVVLTVVLAIGTSVAIGEPSGASGSLPIDMIEVFLRYTVAFVPYAAVALFIALLMRSNAAGIAIGIAIVFVEPILFALLGALSDTFETIQKGGIAWNQNQVLMFGGDNDVTARDALLSAGGLAIWTLILVALSFWIFRRRDVTSG
jgi:ABC-type transport system involved in multi-copper enzyme maturation permease subunit